MSLTKQNSYGRAIYATLASVVVNALLFLLFTNTCTWTMAALYR